MAVNINIDASIFNDVYMPAINSNKKFQIFYGGAGSGKSYFIAQRVILKCLQDKRRVLVIRKTLASQRDSCWKLMVDVLNEWGILRTCNVNRSYFEITFVNGSQIFFKGLDDAEKIKSVADVTDMWIEEATEINEDDFDQLVLRVRSPKPNNQFFLSFNPVSKANWVFKRWFAPGAIVDENNTLIIHSTYKDNKFLSEDYVKSLEDMINTNPTYYKIYALGEFCTLDKLVFNNWEAKELLPADYCSWPDTEVICGIDFGFSNDITAITESYANVKTKLLYVRRVWGSTGKTNDDIAKQIFNMGLQKNRIIADSAEPKSIVEIKEHGIYNIRPSIKGRDSIIHGIQRLQQFHIIVNPKMCKGLIMELENYSWKKDKKSGEYLNEPIDEYNHYIDALRYSTQALRKGPTYIDKKLIF